MRNPAHTTRGKRRKRQFDPDGDAKQAVKWLLRLEHVHRQIAQLRKQPPTCKLRGRPDTIAAALPWWQEALKLAGCRHSRHYARQVRDSAIAQGLVIDTGYVDKPRKQKPTGGGVSWWPIYIIPKLYRRSLGNPCWQDPTPSRRDLASLCSKHISQLRRKDWKPRYGSVQAAFQAHGPP